jgi:NTP pyrophosphatase (non-canonical NTP hydrolase)
MNLLKKIFLEIEVEREKQDAKWGEQNHAPNDWCMILGEEVGEVNKAALEAKFGGKSLREYRQELIQTASVAIAMIECFDRHDIQNKPY